MKVVAGYKLLVLIDLSDFLGSNVQEGDSIVIYMKVAKNKSLKFYTHTHMCIKGNYVR